jgi:hypothetical protein
MAARVIHFGPDDCHRLMVLRSAGYTVESCLSLGQFRAFLLAAVETDAVLLSDGDGDGVAPDQAAALIRDCCSAPVVLFRSTNRAYEEAAFDLVVQSLTPPEAWLREVDALIAKHYVLGGRLAALSPKSAQLLKSTLVSNMSRSEFMPSPQHRARNANTRPGDRLREDRALK